MIYNYQCCVCKKPFEKEMSFSDYTSKIPIVCPKCKSPEIKRTYLSTPVIYKDNGFTKHKGNL